MATDYKKNAQDAKEIAKSNPAAAKVIAQATKTGAGLSNNELTFIRNNASKITNTTDAVAFLGSLQSRLDANTAVATTPTGGGSSTGGGNVVDPTTTYLQAKDEADRRSAYATLEDTFKQYNLEELIPTIKQFLKDNLSPAEAALELRKSDTYKQRFKGNEGRIAKGLQAYSPQEYLNAEEAYYSLLKDTLPGLANKATFQKLIAGGVSPVEAQDRINKVFNKIDNASADVKNELGRYFSQYNVNDPNAQRNQLAEAILSGEDPVVKLEQNVQKAQLRAGATAAGYIPSEQRIESIQGLLSQAGVTDTYKTGQQGFQTLSQLEPSTTKLADIYKEAPVSQEELQKEAFLGLKSERRRKLAETEQATFSGKSGTTQVSLGQQSKGNF